MNSVISAIKTKLDSDATLLAFLGSNSHFTDSKSAATKQNSIFPAGWLKTMKNVPVVTLDQGTFTKRGSFLFDELLYIRAYNDPSATNVTMNDILQRIKTLINSIPGRTVTLDIADGVVVELKWEGRLQPVFDEGFQLRFIEDSYRIYLL